MRKGVIIFLVIISVVALSIAYYFFHLGDPVPIDPEAPAFEDYPAMQGFSGTTAAPDFSSDSDLDPKAKDLYEEETIHIANKMADGVKFDGHYGIAGFACGAGCQYGYIMDLNSGQIISWPSGAMVGIVADPQSALFIVNPEPSVKATFVDTPVPPYLKTEYYVLENGEWKLVHTTTY
jgi:hypothetical protein